MTKGKVYTHDKQRHAGSNAVILSPDERRAQGKALRDAARARLREAGSRRGRGAIACKC